MTPELLRRLRELLADGALILGPRPERAPGLTGFPACDDEVRRLADELWGDGPGHVLAQGTPAEVLAGLGLPPDVTWQPASAPLAWIHRRIGAADAYFIASSSELGEAVEVTFRAGNRAPELWHADTGRIEPAPLQRREADGRVTVPLALEPAGSVFVVFRRGAAERDPIVSLTRAGASVLRHRPKQPLAIQRALYGIQDDPARILAVTEYVRRQVDADTLHVPIWSTLGGDPAPGVVKELVLEYTLGGVAQTARGQDGATLRIAQGGLEPYPAAELRDGQLVAWEPGTYELTTARGMVRRVRVDTVPPPVTLDGPWTVRFDPRWGGPAEIAFPQLVDWSKHADPRVRDYSGTAEYELTFELDPSRAAAGIELVLELGGVRELAEATLNGVELGVLWHPPFRVPISAAARPGQNRLVLRVTNQWTNRLIADAGLPPERRLAWTTFNPYTADAPRAASGLLGPVTIRAAREMRDATPISAVR